MPKYTYKCNNCLQFCEKFHSIKIKLTDCELCKTDCSLERIPCNTVSIRFKSSDGELVKEYIKETKQQVKEYKKELKTEEADDLDID
ncbi:FmdB family transcriptional regulator [bacterium]|nr:FmdB family transcriptional regulator [bacterium]